jgi:NAD(P)-dependent dehydrogenase (short-subunit alcohol dehydrogenase family)
MTENFLNALTPEQFLKIESRHLLGIGETKDVIGPIVFLLSDYAKWITGVNLSVDGGYTLG